MSTHVANHHEVRCVELSVDFYMLEAKRKRFIGDNAFDSDRLDAELGTEDVEMSAPHRSSRRIFKTQDAGSLRRAARRWIMERFFAWLQWKRRLLVLWEYHVANFLAFVHLNCITMLLRRL